MSQTVTIVGDYERCGSCSAKGEVFKVRQGDDTQGWVSCFCGPCFDNLRTLVDAAATKFSNERNRLPHAKREDFV